MLATAARLRAGELSWARLFGYASCVIVAQGPCRKKIMGYTHTHTHTLAYACTHTHKSLHMTPYS